VRGGRVARVGRGAGRGGGGNGGVEGLTLATGRLTKVP
jgi:hypothetical protein